MLILAKTPEARAVVAEYVARRLGVDADRLYSGDRTEAGAVVVGNAMYGGVIFTNFRRYALEMSWAGDCGWATRKTLRDIFTHAFNGLGVLRCNGIVERTNAASRNFAARIGCREAGVLENEYGPGRDGIVYTMTRERCRWIREE